MGDSEDPLSEGQEEEKEASEAKSGEGEGEADGSGKSGSAGEASSADDSSEEDEEGPDEYEQVRGRTLMHLGRNARTPLRRSPRIPLHAAPLPC